MDKFIFQDVSPETREVFIKDNCDEIIENFEYKKPYTPEEIEEIKDDLAKAIVKVQILEERLKKATTDSKAEIKPYKTDTNLYTSQLREGARRVKETCYGFRDFSTNEYGVYSADGELISVPRRLKPAETQKTIRMGIREAANS